jgi:hypothetical protein
MTSVCAGALAILGPDLEWTSDLLGLVGLLLLTWPAVKIDRIGRRIHRVGQLRRPSAAEPAWNELAQGVAKELMQARDAWTFWSSLCLWLGFAVSAASAALKLLPCP